MSMLMPATPPRMAIMAVANSIPRSITAPASSIAAQMHAFASEAGCFFP